MYLERFRGFVCLEFRFSFAEKNRVRVPCFEFSYLY